MFNSENVNYDGKINLNQNLEEIQNINLENMKIYDLKKLARNIFYKYNNNIEEYINNGNKIVVSGAGIDESIEKIYNNKRQRSLLKEHMQIFSDLGDIIEHAKLSHQAENTKIEKNPDVSYWNYYLDGLEINDKKYKLEFDVRSMKDGTNQYRIQRLELDNKKQVNYDGDTLSALPPYSQPVSLNDNTTNEQKSQIALPSINSNMQNNENNTVKLPKVSNPLEISKLTKEDADTTPLLPKRTYQKGDGESSFYNNITEKSKFLNEDLREMMKNEENIQYYQEITNKDTLEKAYEKLQEVGINCMSMLAFIIDNMAIYKFQIHLKLIMAMKKMKMGK